MSEVTNTLPAVSGGYELTRFNALRHGVLSRYTVLPWEDEGEYRALLEALVAEHVPTGPDRGASGGGACWHPLAQAAPAPGRGGRPQARAAGGDAGSVSQDGEGGAGACRRRGADEKTVDAVRATAEDTAELLAHLETVEAMTRRALDLLGSKRNDAYEAALAALHEDTREWWEETLGDEMPRSRTKTRSPTRPMRLGCYAFWRRRSCPGIPRAGRSWRTGH